MAVDVLEIKSATAIPMVELAVAQAPWRAADGDVVLFHARENGVEFAVAEVKRQWSGFDIRYPLGRKLAKRMSNPKLHWD